MRPSNNFSRGVWDVINDIVGSDRDRNIVV